MGAFSADTWLIPLTIDSANKVFKVIEDPGGIPNAVTVTLTEGTYYLHDDTSYHATKKGLYYAIRNVLNAGTGTDGTRSGTPTYTYAWEVSNPTTSTGVTNAGVSLVATSAANDFSIDWTSGTTMDGRWFGYKVAAPAADTTSTSTGALEESVISAYCVRGRLRTHDLLDGAAVQKRAIPRRIVERSSDRVADSVSTIWGTETDRVFRYEDVWPACVDPDRAGDTPYATIAGLGDGDKNNAWHYVWEALTAGDVCICVHNSTSDLLVDSNSWEAVTLAEDLDWEQFAVIQDDGGDLRRISFRVFVTSDASYDH